MKARSVNKMDEGGYNRRGEQRSDKGGHSGL